MKLNKYKAKLASIKYNLYGWRTKRKIVVFESDDWGSIRVPNKEVLAELITAGIRIDKLSFNRYDKLESPEDIAAIFEVLNSVKDKYDNPAIFTFNTIVANPDFKKIEVNNFQEYHYEPFTKTYMKYYGNINSYNLLKEGIKNKLIKPQFHGREHLNVSRWMNALKNNNLLVKKAFKYEMYDLSDSYDIKGTSFMDTYNYNSKNELAVIIESIRSGLKIFKDIFGYESITTIAPCYIWDDEIEKTLYESNVKCIQGSRMQLTPNNGEDINKFNKKIHYTGQKNKYGQIYTTRNISFEPSDGKSKDWISEIMKRIKIAFLFGKPAIISTHRLNYIGGIDVKNRDKNLKILEQLLKTIINKWMDVEFISSDQLYQFIIEGE